MLLTVWFYFFLVFSTIIASIWVILATIVNPQSTFPLTITHIWGTFLVKCLGIQLEVHGRENLQPDKPCILRGQSPERL